MLIALISSFIIESNLKPEINFKIRLISSNHKRFFTLITENFILFVSCNNRDDWRKI